MSADTQIDVVAAGGPDHRRRPDSFEWPPLKKVLDRDALPSRSLDKEAIAPSGDSADSSGVRPAGDLNPALAPRSPRLFRPNSLWPLMSRWQSRVSIPPRVIAIALVTVTLTALFEGAYILRMSSSRTSESRANSSSTFQLNAGNLTDSRADAVATMPQSSATAGATSVAAGPSVSTSTSQTGRLVVNSDPSGALVYIDDRRYGVAPVTVANLEVGQHRLLVRRGATEVTQIVRIEPGAATSVVAAVHGDASASGWVAIASPIEMDIWEDGVLLGTSRSPQIMLATGLHSLEFVNESLEYRHKQQVGVKAGKIERVEMTLPQSVINLNASPWAEVWIDGVLVGETPIANLPLTIGKHEVAFRHPDLGEKVLLATVKAGSPTRLTADLRQKSAGSQ